MATRNPKVTSRVLARLKPQFGKEPVRFIEELAEKMVRTLGRTEPPFQTDAFEYAVLAGAKVLQTNIPKYSGLMSVFDGRIIIEINRDDSLERKNFTVCHEVGHIELRKAANLLRPSRARRGRFIHKEKSGEGTSKTEERLVEEFAANILMPRQVFSDKARELTPGLESAMSLSKMFLTSLGATLRRIVSLRVWPCVMIWGIPEKMIGENVWAVRIQEFKNAIDDVLRCPKHRYVWWAGEQFARSSQSPSIVTDTVTIESKLWRFEGLREWHYTRSGERENRVMAMLLPAENS
jgi:Zn-dependent peptidase ImmA (M78 family)